MYSYEINLAWAGNRLIMQVFWTVLGCRPPEGVMKISFAAIRAVALCAAVVALILALETPSFAQGQSGPVVSHPTSSAVSQPLWAIPQAPARGAVPQGPLNVPL